MLKQQVTRALGLMSGTSLDGVDAAVLDTDGEVIHGFGPTAFRPYSAAERAALFAAQGLWQGDPQVEPVAELIETAHAEVMARFSDIEIVGFHGQTLAHDPSAGRTHQAGSGAVLALVSGLPVVWDFRSSDVHLGGQGAPLAPFYHFALAKYLGATEPLAFLNLGGVGNLTYIDPRHDRPDMPGALLAFDTGPANAPIDDLCQARLGQPRDTGGVLAAQGTADDALVAGYLAEGYFRRRPPKSLDRASDLGDRVAHLDTPDALATLAACAAGAVATGYEHLPDPPARLLVCGGGRHNPELMRRIAAAVPSEVLPVEDVGLDGDMLEAQAFAYLAVRVARGLSTSCPATTGVAAAVGGGQISHP
ncbi:Anhydro-N-acetylmuramic acid kinase [Roseibaca ekhonensis]|uniref:Anhydro-N-acetylmuramic acid kinase n=1 Tax=Roseinatronobacter ekhonensis TaxID=254356 RepID=A0A3B0MMQ0_9RHOB|nr:anhydro-N-acetylmuramic acid kinase [Roseibaca ekhonensis]SUZ30949.1 Anhydro-N-acetylmuramic acid kinase [Roseibaca ekhonensis]